MIQPPLGSRKHQDANSTLAPITCSDCGSEEFDHVQRAFLKYDRLNPKGGMAIVPAAAFKCSHCGMLMNAGKRIEEITSKIE